MSVFEDITSKDPHRIWLSSGAIRLMRDLDELRYLASHLEEIKEKTEGVDLGGLVRLNSTHLDFALRKLEWIRTSKECLCRLYLLDDMYDPERESKAENVRITRVVQPEGTYVDYYECECTLCGQRFKVDEGEYHHTWWAWQLA